MGLHKLPRLRKETLKRVLGVFDLFSIGYGDLGSSIFYALGVTAFFSLGATPISLLLAGIVFICTALSYAEMCGMFHESGGSASFARKAFNDLISFIAGWGLLLDYIVTIAISSFAVGPYLSYFFFDLKDPQIQISFAVGLIALLFLINVCGVKQSTRLSLVLTGCTLLVEAVIIGLGCYFVLDLSHIVHHLSIANPGDSLSPSWTEFWQGTAMAMVAYTGIESIAQLGAESKTPSKVVPRAIFLTMIILILVYVGISLVALSAVSPHELGTKYVSNPLNAITQFFPFGNWILAPSVALIAAAILAVGANAGLIGSSRLSFNMGEYYQLPRFFYHINQRFRTPTVALAFFSVVACAIIIASGAQMDFLADLYNFGAMLAFLSAHLSLIVLRVKQPHAHRPFKIPLNLRFKGVEIPISALLGVLATFSVWCLVVITKPAGRYLGIGWMICGIIMYIYYRKSRKIEPMTTLNLEEIHVPGYQPIEIKQMLLPITGKMHIETIQMACSLAKQAKSHLTLLYVLEIPQSIPLDSNMEKRMQTAQGFLKIAGAIAHEFHLHVEMELVRSRSFTETVMNLVHTHKHDFLVLGTLHLYDKGVHAMMDKLIKEAKCRVIVSAGHLSSETLHSQMNTLLHTNGTPPSVLLP